jgi:hypothetical protein
VHGGFLAVYGGFLAVHGGFLAVHGGFLAVDASSSVAERPAGKRAPGPPEARRDAAVGASIPGTGRALAASAPPSALTRFRRSRRRRQRWNGPLDAYAGGEVGAPRFPDGLQRAA